MGGLAVLLAISLYLIAGYWAIKTTKASRFKWLVVAVVVLLPSADAIVGRVYLKYLCGKEGGLKVYRVAKHVEGFMSDTFWDGDYWLKNYGFQFSESPPVNGLVTRYSIQNGILITESNVPSKSLFRVRYVSNGETYVRAERRVEMIGSNEVLASYKGFSFRGGWAERFLAAFTDAGVGNVAFCDRDPSHSAKYEVVQVVTSSLKH